MLGIILGILKIIAFIVLFILAFLILIILLILIAPLNYKTKLLYKEKIDIKLNANYFFYIFRFHLVYKDNLEYSLKIFNFTIFSNDEDDSEENSDDSENIVIEENSLYKESICDNKGFTNRKDDIPVTQKESDTFKVNKQEKFLKDKNNFKKDVIIEENKENTGADKEEFKHKEKNFNDVKIKKSGMRFFIKDKINIFKTRLKSIKKRLGQFDKKKKKIFKSIKDEKNRLAIKILFKLLIKLLKHILPQRVKGRVEFGFEDPATTANIVGYISLLHPKYYKRVDIIPVFNNEIIDINLDIRGRIQLIYILYILIIGFFDKNIRRLYTLYREKKLF